MKSFNRSDVGLRAHSGPDINGYFDIEESSTWLRLVGRCIVRLRSSLLISTGTTLKRKHPIDDTDLLYADEILRILRLLLGFPAIKWLFLESSLQVCFELKRSPGMPFHHQSHMYDSLCVQSKDDIVYKDKDEDLDEDEDETDAELLQVDAGKSCHDC